MELQTAIEILEYHQEWRLGKREGMIHEPKKLTEALDIVLAAAGKKDAIHFGRWILKHASTHITKDGLFCYKIGENEINTIELYELYKQN